MKILYVNYLYDIKLSSVGAAVHVEELAKALRKLNNVVNVFFLNRFTGVEDSVRKPVRKVLKKYLSTYLGSVNSLISNVFYFIKEWKLLIDEKPEILLVRYNIFNFSIAIVAKILRIPFILEINAPMAYEKKMFGKSAVKLSSIGWLFERLMINYADILYVVSNQLKEFYIERNVPSWKIHVIFNGVDEKKINISYSSNKISAEYDLQDRKVLGFVGSFHYWHGVEQLQSFIMKILSRYDNTAFLMVGDGPLKHKMECFVKENRISDNVIFTGYVEYDNIPSYLAAMDIVLAPYPNHKLFYYSPIKLFEYMAAGKSVIATSIGQIKEIIEDGVNGILFEAENYDEMLEKSYLLLQDDSLCRRIGAEARKTIERNYTWGHTAKELNRIIECEVIGKDNGVEKEHEY